MTIKEVEYDSKYHRGDHWLSPFWRGCSAGQQILINGAGATFPYPMYSKWFDEYHKKFPNLQFNYQSIGSGGGIQQVTAGHGRFRSQRRSDERRADQGSFSDKQRLQHPAFPDGAGRGRADLQRSRRHGAAQLHAAKRWPGFSWARSPSGTIRN